MVSAHNITTKKDFVIPLQWLTEGDSIATPALFGVVPSSPSYTAAGRVLELEIIRDIADTPINVLGDEDVFDQIKNEELYSFTVKSQIYDTTLLKYGVNAANGSGTIDESLTFKFSKYASGTEVFTEMTGCRCASTTLTLERGAWEMDQTWICKSISLDNSTDPDTTPTNVTALPTDTVWRHQDAGSTPFLWNSVNFGERSFSMTVTRDLGVMKVNGDNEIIYSKPTHRNIEFSVDVIRSGITLVTDYEAKTKRAAVYEINDGTAQINFTNATIIDWTERHTATDTDLLIEPITGRAESVAVADS